MIYGDYDVDGITGTSILVLCLRLLGANVKFHIPHRFSEGYGLNETTLQNMHDDGNDFVISVDCGVTAISAAKVAAANNTELIITDHHEPPVNGELPECFALVHPSLLGSTRQNRDLCGAGVAWMLAWAICQCVEPGVNGGCSPRGKQFLHSALSLAALGTIADCVKLDGENRTIVYHGLKQLSGSNFPGLRAFIQSAGFDNETVNGFDVGFRLGPRINAAGRMGHAGAAVEMLTTTNFVRALEIAEEMEKKNKDRQVVERKIVKQAIAQYRKETIDPDAPGCIVVRDSQWHPGVIGIVAARLVEEFKKPAIVFVQDGASCRSIEGLSLIDCLRQCDEYLSRYGGHAAACGLHIKEGCYESFKTWIDIVVAKKLTPEMRNQSLNIEYEARLAEIDLSVVETIEKFGPFGRGNRRPLFLFPKVIVDKVRRIGAEGQYLSLSVKQDEEVVKGIWFKPTELQLNEGDKINVVGNVNINTFRGDRSVQIEVTAIEKCGEDAPLLTAGD